MRYEFPPTITGVALTVAQWENVVDTYFFPVGPFTFTNGWVNDRIGRPYWQIFEDSSNKRKYKYCNRIELGDKVIVEPFDEGIDKIVTG